MSVGKVNIVAGVGARAILLFSVLWLTACANHPRPLDANCLRAGEYRLSGQYLLEVESPGVKQQLLVVSHWQHDQLRLLGLNAVGAKLFSATLSDDQLTVEPSQLYRGPADLILWGLLLHQVREQLPQCWAESALQWRGEGDSLALLRRHRPIFSSSRDGVFTLPTKKITVEVKRLQ